MGSVGWLWRLIRWLYDVKNESSTSGEYEEVVPHEYGALPNNISGFLLPDATRICLILAARTYLSGKAGGMAWGSTDNFGPGAQVLHDQKWETLLNHGVMVPREKVIQVSSNNTIQEVRAIRDALGERAKDINSILVICDWRHARRSRIIWKHFFKDAKIFFRTVNANWNEGHPSPWQKSSFRWLCCNLIHHAAILVLGVDRMGGIVQHTEK